MTHRVPTIRKRRRAPWVLALPACVLMATTGLAHPGHEDALTTLQAIWRGKAAIRWLVDKERPVDGKVLDASWNEIGNSGSCRATPLYYLVSLDNPAQGKTLYLLLNHSGGFMRARFKADFAELRFTASFPMVDCDGP